MPGVFTRQVSCEGGDAHELVLLGPFSSASAPVVSAASTSEAEAAVGESAGGGAVTQTSKEEDEEDACMAPLERVLKRFREEGVEGADAADDDYEDKDEDKDKKGGAASSGAGGEGPRFGPAMDEQVRQAPVVLVKKVRFASKPSGNFCTLGMRCCAFTYETDGSESESEPAPPACASTSTSLLKLL